MFRSYLKYFIVLALSIFIIPVFHRHSTEHVHWAGLSEFCSVHNAPLVVFLLFNFTAVMELSHYIFLPTTTTQLCVRIRGAMIFRVIVSLS